MRGAASDPRERRTGRLARLPAIVLAAAVLGLSACGGGGGAKPTLVVSAAASLQKALTRYGSQFLPARARFSFAGSDTLAAQIEQGARPDVFASANTKLPQMLYAKGLLDRPVVFAANSLVLAVPADSTNITSFADVEKPGIALSVGTVGVPVGAYTQTVLGKLPSYQRSAVLTNVRDREPDVTGIVGKLTEGAADAGFLYITDVTATAGQLKAISLPAGLQPQVAYGIGVVKGTTRPRQASAFVAGLLEGSGRADLLAAGFLPPPNS